MVGVGGRSKACNNCRLRRVKCDEVKPKCQRCARANLQCEGYPDMTIIQFDGRRQRKISPPSNLTSSSGANNASWVSQSPDGLATASSLFRTHIPLFSDDIFVQYITARLLQGPQIAEIALPPGMDRSLFNKAFLALATTFFGVEHKEKTVLTRGLLRYGDALKHVHQALGDPSRHQSYDLLESISVMTLFEFLIADNENGWLSHTEGLERLISLRGPDSFKTYPNYIILQNYRPSIIFSCIVLRKDTVLSKPEWKTIPWSLYPESKTDMQFLVDILADCPGLFVQKEEIESSPPSCDRSVKYAKLQKNVFDILDQLKQWEQDWETNNPGYSYEVPAPDTTPTFVDQRGRTVPAWETVIEYKSLHHSNAIVVYNAAVILVQTLAQRIAFSGALPPVSQNKANFPDRTFAAGLSICRSVEYHLQSMRKGAGSFVLLFPLRMAYDSIGRSTPSIGTWLRDVLQQIQDGKSGRWATAKYLLDIKPQRKRRSMPL